MKNVAFSLTVVATLLTPWLASAQEAVKKCLACHTFDQGGAKKIGPNLFGIFGKTSTLPDLAAKGVVWDEPTLMEYLANPSAFVSAKTAGASVRRQLVMGQK